MSLNPLKSYKNKKIKVNLIILRNTELFKKLENQPKILTKLL